MAQQTIIHTLIKNDMYVQIKQGIQLPEDFLIDGVINRDKYIVEMGFYDLDKWYNEHQFQPTAEIVGAIVIGSNQYNSIRYRVRTEHDKPFDLAKTIIGKLINS
jgi:hypothetical protein